MLSKTISSIFWGSDSEDELNINEDNFNINEILRRFSEYFDLQALISQIIQIQFFLSENGNREGQEEEGKDEEGEQSDDDEESSEENNQQQQQTFQIYEPNLIDIQPNQSSIPNLTEYLQSNPTKRTFLKSIAQGEGFFNNNYNTRSNVPPKSSLYHIYALSDFRYAPTQRVKRIFTKIIDNFIHKKTKKKINRFSKDYFNSLLQQQFQVLNQQQIEQQFNQNKAIEQVEQSFKSKKDQKELEKALSTYVKLQNETKENFLIISQQQKNFNYYEYLNQSQNTFRSPLNTADFYKELESIIKKRKVTLDSEAQRYEINLNSHQTNNQNQDGVYIDQEDHAEDDEKIHQTDNFQVDQFFSNLQNYQNEPKLWGQIKKQQNYSTYKPFSFEQEIQQPGFQLYSKIKQQQETERKLNEQLKDKNEQDDLRKSKTVASKQDGTVQDSKKEKPSLSKMEEEFQKQLENFSYLNDEIVNFCMGNSDNFLTKPSSHFNRIEIDLNDPNFFSEKLSFVLHLQKPKLANQGSRAFKEQQSILSKANDQNSLISLNRHDFASKNNDRGSEDSEIDSESNFTFKNENQESQFPQNDNQLRHELQIQIQGHQKKKAQTAILNSQIAEKFELNNFSQKVEDHSEYHRCNFLQIFISTERNIYQTQIIWKTLAMKGTTKQQSNSSGSSIFDVIPEQLNSQDHFKTCESLSLTKSQPNFVLFEYTEQRPLVMNNAGMGIKIQRYVYENRALDQFFNSRDYFNRESDEIAFGINKFKQLIVEKLGKFGQIQFLQKNETLPLQGQILDENIIGVTILENDLYRAPIFKQKLPETDFLLIRKLEIDQNGKANYIYRIRQIEFIYLVGQIEPKIEIYTPHSRSLGTFSKNCLKTYIKQRFQYDQGRVQFKDLQDVFYKQSEQNIRNALKECSGNQDLNVQGQWIYTLSDNPLENTRNPIQYDITAKQVCLYESMLNSSYMLEKQKKTIFKYLDQVWIRIIEEQ